MSGPELELVNPGFVDLMVGRQPEGGIDGFLGLITFIGNMHGGCLAALCDHCLGVVLYPVMPPRSWAATTEFKVNYLRPVSGGTCRATAEVVSMTKRLAVVSIRVENEGRLVAVAQGTCTVKLAEDKEPDA